jgi:hypothetical protein
MECRDAKQTHGMGRREVLQVGTGLFGLTLFDFLNARSSQAASNGQPSKDISCIFLFLAGGASHYETFDPKPDATQGVLSIWDPTSTSVPGTFICEKMPMTAKLMHKVALVRSWQGIDGRHDGGSQHALNGFPTGPNSSTSKQHYPNIGCLVSALAGTRVAGVPSHIGMPVAGRYTDPPGYLGKAFSAFDIRRDPSQPDFQLSEKLVVADERFDDRRRLLNQIDNVSSHGEHVGQWNRATRPIPP